MTKLVMHHRKAGWLCWPIFSSDKNIGQTQLQNQPFHQQESWCDWSVAHVQIHWKMESYWTGENDDTYRTLWRKCCSLWSCWSKLL